MEEQDASAQSQELIDLLLASPFAEAFLRNAPLLVAGGKPARLAYCNRSALELFAVAGQTELFTVVLAGDSQGAHRFRRIANDPPEGAPRIELLRFFVGRKPVLIGLMCARLTNARGEPFLAASPPPLTSVQPAKAIVSGDPEHAEPVPMTSRFVWASDAAGRFAAPSPVLLELVGSNAPGAAETLDQLQIRMPAGDLANLARAVASHAAFSSVRSLWPSAGGRQNLVALLSGSPTYDRQRRFLGYRGFGVFTGEFETLPEPIAEASEAGSPSMSENVLRKDMETPAPALAASQPVERSAEIVALRPAFAVVPGHPNVVPIRPGSMRVLTAENPGRSNNNDSIALTTDERDAFREIALALGARIRQREEKPANTFGDRSAALAPSNEALRRTESFEGPRDMIDLSGRKSGEGDPIASDLASAPNAAAAAADFNRLLDSLPVGALVACGKEPLYLNRTLLDLLGYRDMEEFRHAGGLAHMFKGWDPEQSTPPGDGRPLSLVAVNGELIAVNARLQAIEWDGAAASLISLRRSRDAEYGEKLKALEAEVRGFAARSLAILDQAGDGAVVIDRQGNIQSMSASAQTLLGCEQKGTVGASLDLLLTPESHDAVAAYFNANWNASRDDARRASLEVVAKEQRGSGVHLSLTLVNGGMEDQRIVVLRDITASVLSLRDSQTARIAAEKTSSLKSEMLSAISHEIRTPLNAILGFTEVMRDERFGAIGNERYKQYVNDIHLSGAHVLSLANDLLDLSKIEAGKFELDFLPLDANRIIQECVTLMQPRAAQDRIIMRLSLFDKLPPVLADERSLRQIILNLMSNAVKFNEPGGQVIVSSVLSESHQAVIRVRDTGIGMNEAELIAALEPFRQVSGKRGVGGTGLGLPLTKALVEANKARFSINSRREQGTLVELTFPIAHAAAAQ